jgi:8-oxo-dGTP diphosphatase
MPSDERQFLESYDPSVFERPSVAVDVVLMSVGDGALHALLAPRSDHPEKGKWALPGGFVGAAESLEDAVGRVMREKAGLSGIFVEQLYTFGAVDRDPRTRVITVAYYALFDPLRDRPDPTHRNGLEMCRLAVPWSGERGGAVSARGADGKRLTLAFDHDEVLGMAVKRLRGKLDYSPVGFELLPARFTLGQLQAVHEAILGRKLNKPAFRRRMLDKGFLKATGKRQEGVAYRPAELYRFTKPNDRRA